MEENISVQAAECCIQLALAERYVPQRHFAIYSFISGRIFVYGGLSWSRAKKRTSVAFRCYLHEFLF
jgi:hypothetical protein